MTEFEDIYNNYFKDIFLYIYSLSGDRHIAEDITAETFMKAIKSIEKFKGNCDIRVWLYQIAKNCYFSFLRKKKKTVHLDELSEQKDNFNFEQIISSTEESMEIHEILHNLDEPYKEVFSLRVFGELSFKQIACLFGKSDNWACVTYHRARNKIKERMEDYK
ncbi:DNA-directed RNA polymerase subunit sigma [Clostridium sulfidigenes]|uniref:DNA-directed RNA polymerase subunit sigma n=1 Tax=Clostridium sulfidigenes TaxID=318464 RepID=A0A084J784_9CLOT|nr:RNA polymerase sigma factor [Clostridium sulfidigenes]KEZ84818.1 DNA-directed RNA polymerase subunit sigma [Clostridium sulfidigenes]